VASSAGWAIFASADWLIFRPPRIGRVADDRAAAGVYLDRMRTRLARLPRLRLDPDLPSRVHGLVFRKPLSLHVLWGGA